MKTGCFLRIGLCCLFGLIVTSCNEYQPPKSRFGTGRYQCYYQDDRHGKFFQGVDDDENVAVRLARKSCLHAKPKDLDHVYCEFAECVFK